MVLLGSVLISGEFAYSLLRSRQLALNYLPVFATRRSWVLREVFRGFSKEARTRGFPSPPFGQDLTLARYLYGAGEGSNC